MTTTHWQFDPDPEWASEIEVTFTALGAEQTTVEHRDLDRLEGGQGIHDAINGGGGALLLEGFANTTVKTS